MSSGFVAPSEQYFGLRDFTAQDGRVAVAERLAQALDVSVD